MSDEAVAWAVVLGLLALVALPAFVPAAIWTKRKDAVERAVGSAGLWLGWVVVAIGVPLGALYLLVRFVKWAWAG